jgi:site-specific DNA recombinase
VTGNWNNDQAYYRCRFPAEYALANRVDHPKTVYLREADVTGPLDAWLGQAFDPARMDATLALLAD